MWFKVLFALCMVIATARAQVIYPAVDEPYPTATSQPETEPITVTLATEPPPETEVPVTEPKTATLIVSETPATTKKPQTTGNPNGDGEDEEVTNNGPKATKKPKTTRNPNASTKKRVPKYLKPIPLKKCENVEKIGCFNDNVEKEKRALKDQLIANTRDIDNKKFRFPMLDWMKWNDSMQTLACRCAKSARTRGHKYFGLQFYGECWSGQQLNYGRYGKAPEDGCVGDKSPAETCQDDDRFCVGKQFNNYVYRLANLCGKKTYDLGFMLDSSGSISKNNYKKVLRFIANIANEFKVSSPNTHVSLMHFATQSFMDFSFKDDVSKKQNKLQKQVRKMKKVHSGRTYTKTALDFASKEMFCETCGARKNVKKVLVVFTDGKSNDKGAIKKKSFAEVKEPLDKQNVRVIAVGIDNNIDVNELKEIASSRKVVGKDGTEKIEYDTMKFKTNKLYQKLKSIVGVICQ